VSIRRFEKIDCESKLVAVGETPGEHLERSVRADPRVAGAGPLVRAFETLRYGESGPDDETIAAARAALADLVAR